MQYVILAVTGRDRPGIVAGVTGVLFEVGANLLDTSMCILSGHFASLVVAALPDPGRRGALDAALPALERDLGITVTCTEVEQPPESSTAAAEDPESTEGFLVQVMGSDHPGIVYRVSHMLADLGANITDMESRRIGAPDHRVYVMMLEVTPPEGLEEEGLDEKLQELARELDVEIRVRSLDPATL